MRALVTGASGLIGAHVARALTDDGVDVRAFCRTPPPPEARVAEHVRGDVRDADAVRRAVRGCDAVIHAAALYSYTRAAIPELEAVNVGGTRNVLAAAAGRRVVFTSSSATCGPVAGRAATEDDEPPDWELGVAYKRSKIDAEAVALVAAAEGQDVVIVNPTTTIGAGDRRPTPSGKMIRDLVAGRAIGYIPSAGVNVVAVEDVARGHVLALERGRAGERYILGGDNVPLRELFAIAARRARVAEPRVPLPYSLVRAAAYTAYVGGRLRGMEPTLLVRDEVRLARLPLYFSSAKAERELEYKSRPAEEAIASAVDWFRATMPPPGENAVAAAFRAVARGTWRRRRLPLPPL
jgi:dihydroflavonol-4-reductase